MLSVSCAVQADATRLFSAVINLNGARSRA
jgi:hypothetical protein